MKTKIISFLCAVALAMCVPALAFAAEFSSPGGASATNNGTTLHMSGDTEADGGYIVVEASDTPASNAVIGSGDYSASFRAYKVGDVSFTSIGLTFNVPAQYIGANAVVYVSYASGNQAAYPVVIDSNGIATASITEIHDDPSYFTIVVNAGTATGPQDGGKDTSAVSPQTGVGFTGVAAAAGAMLVVAGGVAVALRKKTNA